MVRRFAGVLDMGGLVGLIGDVLADRGGSPFFEGLGLLMLTFFCGYLGTRWLLPPLKRAFLQAGLVRANFRGQTIPVGMGSALWFGLFWTGGLLLVASGALHLPERWVRELLGLLVVCTGLFVVGLLDDVVGNREATGLRGHLRKLLVERQVTTGLLKAMTGLGVGLLGAWLMAAEGWRLPLGALCVALSANGVNLLDLRPGRACKGVLLLLLCIAMVSSRGLQSPAFWLLLSITLAYLPDDLHARTMMGDAGSNLLGGGIGVLVVSTCGEAVVLGWVAALVLFHLYTEKRSLSEAIEKNRLLRWLDVLGLPEST